MENLPNDVLIYKCFHLKIKSYIALKNLDLKPHCQHPEQYNDILLQYNSERICGDWKDIIFVSLTAFYCFYNEFKHTIYGAYTAFQAAFHALMKNG